MGQICKDRGYSPFWSPPPPLSMVPCPSRLNLSKNWTSILDSKRSLAAFITQLMWWSRYTIKVLHGGTNRWKYKVRKGKGLEGMKIMTEINWIKVIMIRYEVRNWCLVYRSSCNKSLSMTHLREKTMSSWRTFSKIASSSSFKITKMSYKCDSWVSFFAQKATQIRQQRRHAMTIMINIINAKVVYDRLPIFMGGI